MKRIIVFTLFMFIGISTVYGECSSADIVLYKEEVSNIKISYEQEEDVFDAFDSPVYDSYILKIENLKDDYYILDADIGISVGSNYLDDSLVSYDNGFYFVNGINSGNKKFQVYKNDCSYSLREIEVFLPVYNYYYEDSLCEGVNRKKVKLCSKWLDREISYEEFTEEMTKYRDENNISSDNSLFENILSFFKNNLKIVVVILSLLTLILCFLILKIFKKRKRNELL